MPLAPIALFVYDRAMHTEKTLESLMLNDLADQSELFIYCDGPKEQCSPEQLAKILAVREVVRKKQWCRKVTVVEADRNNTHPVNLVQRVTELLQTFDSVIVLEDDLHLGKGFLKYMNEALNLYKNDATVMHISGYVFPLRDPDLPATFFIHYMSCWGWATWKKSWDLFVHDAQDLIDRIKKTQVHSFNMDGSYDFIGALKRCAQGPWKSWDIRWYASIFLNHGLVLYPKVSLVRNIGHDGSGMHCEESVLFSSQPYADEIQVTRSVIAENKAARQALSRSLTFIYDRNKAGDYIRKFARSLLPGSLYALLKKGKNSLFR